MICFIGTDGSGKTTLAKKLVIDLTAKGVAVKYVWFRSPYFLTLVVLAVARVLGFTSKPAHSSGTIVHHDFHTQPLRTVYPVVLLWDTLIHYAIRLWLPSRLGISVVCDRYLHDIIVDISMDIHNEMFAFGLVGRLFQSVARRATLVVLVDAPTRTLDIRRPDAKSDPWTACRRSMYHSLPNWFELHTISTGGKVDATYVAVTKIMASNPRVNYSSRKVYGKIGSPWLRLLLKRRFFAIVSNWVFQATLMMTGSERTFRFILEVGLDAGVFALLLRFLGPIESFVLSLFLGHTINWTFNGNFWATQKFYRRKFSRLGKIRFLVSLGDLAKSHWGIAAIAAFGSLSRGEFDEMSDLDVRVVRKKGGASWVKANLFGLRVRSAAFLKGLPLDLFVLDSLKQLHNISQISRYEAPVVIYDPERILGQSNSTALNAETQKSESLKSDSVLDSQ